MTNQFLEKKPEDENDARIFEATINELKQVVRKMQRELDTIKNERNQALLAESTERKREHRRLKDSVEAIRNTVNSLIRR